LAAAGTCRKQSKTKPSRTKMKSVEGNPSSDRFLLWYPFCGTR
jgi:hypothetical protein